MECFPRRYEAFAQVPGKRCSVPPDGLETPQLAHPIRGLSVDTDGRLIFEVERDRAENLSQCQSLEFRQIDSGERPSLKHWTMESRDIRVPAR